MYKPQQPKDCVDTYSEGKDLDYTCLGFLFTAAEEQSEFRRDDWLDSRLKSGQLDYRATYENMKKNAYQCSELWFCPDPCYPNERLFGLNPAEDTRQDDNPCGKLKNPKCNRDPEANANFLDLIGNRFVPIFLLPNFFLYTCTIISRFLIFYSMHLSPIKRNYVYVKTMQTSKITFLFLIQNSMRRFFWKPKTQVWIWWVWK